MTKFKNVFMLVSIALFSLSLIAKTPDESPLAKLEKADSIANLLMTVADENVKSENACGISVEKAFQMMNHLQSKIDDAKNAYLKQRKALKKLVSEPTWATTCAAQCHCGVYAATLEKVGFEKLKLEDQKAYRIMSNMAMNQTAATLAKCATSVKDFCGSPLHKELLKSVSENGN